MRLPKLSVAFFCLALVTSPSAADLSPQIELAVSRDLPRYVQGVDVNDLTNRQISAIYLIMNGGDSDGDIRSKIQGVLGGMDVLLTGRNWFFGNERQF